MAKVIGNPTATTINIGELKEQVNGLSEDVNNIAQSLIESDKELSNFKKDLSNTYNKQQVLTIINNSVSEAITVTLNKEV